MWVQSLGWEDPMEEGMATHSSILAWKIPMDREEPGRLQSIRLQRAGPDTHTITLWGDTINKIDESKAILGGMVVWDRVS